MTQAASVQLNRETIVAMIALETYAKFRPIDPSLNLVPRRDLKCTLPRRTQLVTTAGKQLTCDEPALVITAVPVVDNRAGERGFAAQMLCLDHSAQFAVWKLIAVINEAQAQAAAQRRIITI